MAKSAVIAAKAYKAASETSLQSLAELADKWLEN